MRVSDTLFTWISTLVWITFSASCLISSYNSCVNGQTVELRRPRYGFGQPHYSSGRSILTTFNVPGHLSDPTRSKVIPPKESIHRVLNERPGYSLDHNADKRNSLRVSQSDRHFGRRETGQETHPRQVSYNEKNHVLRNQSRRQFDLFKSASHTKNTGISDTREMEDNATQTRWWLDTIAKLLHSHPLVSDGRSHLYSSSLIDLDQVETGRIDSVSQFSDVTPESDSASPMLFRENNFPQSNNLGSFIHGSPTVVGWRKQQLLSNSMNNMLPGDQIRKRIQLYRKLMSPKQWKQFLAEALPGQSNMQFNLALLEASVIGVRRAVAECRYQFRHERWNCSQVPNTDTVLFGNLLLKGIPQTAFVYSIINAGIVQSVAEACLGRIDNCPCNNQGRETSTSNWQWQGCDHNIHYSRKFSRRLLDTMEQGSHIRFRMNLHNNKVGRQLVMKNMERYCRCHGTSGSCTLRTCYRRTPRMRTLGNLLKQIYETNSIRIHPDSALFQPTDPRRIKIQNSVKQRQYKRTSVRHILGKIDNHANDPGQLSSALRYASQPQWSTTQFDFTNDQSALSAQAERRLTDYAVVTNTNLTDRIRRTQLVYYETVPQSLFCEANPRLHIPGTHHRVCNSTSAGPDNCAQLCCGRGFLTNHYYTMESCNCKFIWCCRVQCQQCLVLKKMETCL